MWFIACQLNLNKAAKDYDAHELSGPTALPFHLNY